VEPQKHIAKRLSFYKSKMIVEQIGKGEHYDRIQRVICVCIISKPLFPGVREYLNRFQFFNEANGLRFDAIPEEIYTLELSKVPLVSDGTNSWEWVQFLLARTKEEIEMLAQRNPEIRKAANALYELSADPEVRAEYEARLKAWRDRAAQIDDAREEERDVWRAVVATPARFPGVRGFYRRVHRKQVRLAGDVLHYRVDLQKRLRFPGYLADVRRDIVKAGVSNLGGFLQVFHVPRVFGKGLVDQPGVRDHLLNCGGGFGDCRGLRLKLPVQSVRHGLQSFLRDLFRPVSFVKSPRLRGDSPCSATCPFCFCSFAYL